MRLAALCLMALIAACTPRVQTDPVTGRVDVDVQPVTQRGEVWTGTLRGQGSLPGISGTARATVLEGQTTVSVTVSGAAPGAMHPWHVHEGACGSGGPIVGEAAAYPLLRVGSEGRAEANAQLALALNEAKEYYINVHASPSDLGTIIACGAIDD